MTATVERNVINGRRGLAESEKIHLIKAPESWLAKSTDVSSCRCVERLRRELVSKVLKGVTAF